MPTLIDELVVALSLDARKFREGTAQAEVATREVGRRTEAGLGAVSASAQKYADSITTVLDGLARGPVQALYVALTRLIVPALKNAAAASTTATTVGATAATRTAAAATVAGRAVVNTGAQATRTGAAVAAGARAGTLGFEALAVAAVGAGVAIYAVDKALKTAYESATKTYGASLGAAAAGLPVGTFSAIQNALAPAPPEEVGAALEARQQALNQISQGHPEQAQAWIQALAMAAPGMRYDAPVQDVLRQLAINFKRLADQGRLDLAITQGGNLGISPAVVKQLSELGAKFPAAVAAAPHITPADVKAAEDYLRATARLSQAWERLTRDLVTRFEPALEAVLNGIRALVDSFDNMGKALTGVHDANLNDIIVLFQALKDLLSGNFIQAFKDLGNLSDLKPREPGAAQIPPARYGEYGYGGVRGEVIPHTASTDLLSGTGMSAAQYDTFRQYLAGRESSGYGEPPNQEGYMGRYQMGPDEIKEAAARLGIANPSQSEFLSNPDLQERLFENYTLAHHNQLMSNPAYANASPERRAAILAGAHLGGVTGVNRYLAGGSDASDRLGTHISSYVTGMGAAMGAPAPDQGKPIGPQSMLNSPSYQAQLAMVRGAQSSSQIAMAGGGDTTHNMTNTVGDITINSAATDEKVMVAELRDSIRRNLLIDTQNGAFAA